jgi:chromate reductase
MENIAVMVGSLSPHSVNRKLARTLQALAEGKLQFHFLDIASLPHYDNELWANPPQSVLDLKQQVEAADGVLIALPEYNRSFPGIIKNALDWGSRPFGQSSWADKPVTLVGATPGTTGTAAGQGHLRASCPSMA